LLRAIEQLRAKGYQNLSTFSPVPSERLLRQIEQPPSPIRFYTLAGGILGLAVGLGFPIWSSLQWEIMSGGKPVVSIPPFLVIAFELTVLLAGVLTAAGLVIHARLWWGELESGPLRFYDPRFSEDRFGIVVPCMPQDAEAVEQSLRAAGFEEVFAEGG
ncbi:MAG TPA: DUF3341 domain-containing protein, partial [Terriglobia bacterium]|nr:DUF3341 domain-containing protein [Terriglobia bacterium]